MQTLSQQLVEEWINTHSTGKFHYRNVCNGTIQPSSYGHLRVIIHRLVEMGKIRPIGERDGWYEKICSIQPVRWWEVDENVKFDLSFPRSYYDDACFSFADKINIAPGDLIVLAGTSNAGKTTLALNFLAENIDKDYKCVLMGNEYVSLNNMPSPRFKKRLSAMNWVKWFDENLKPKFELLPVQDNFENYIQKDKLNIIDWIYLPDNVYMVGKVLQDIKGRLGKGVGIAVLQKASNRDLGVGGQFTEYRADLYMSVDILRGWESRLTLGKVKDSTVPLSGMSWAFSIEEGAKLANIREVKKCHKCNAFGKRFGKTCDTCHGNGWVSEA